MSGDLTSKLLAAWQAGATTAPQPGMAEQASAFAQLMSTHLTPSSRAGGTFYVDNRRASVVTDADQ
jgi:hypothetical protein